MKNIETLKDNFINTITNDILSGKLSVGLKLPTERELAKEFDISRSVVNRGLVHLSNIGFLEIRPRFGTYVSDYKKNGKIDTLISIMRYKGNTINDSELRSIVQMKGVVDSLTINILHNKFSEENYDLLNNILCQINSNTSYTANEYSEIIYSFYHEFSALSGNVIIPLLYSSFKTPLNTLWVRFIDIYSIEPLLLTAKTILEAMHNNNIEKALSTLEYSIFESTEGKYKIYY